MSKIEEAAQRVALNIVFTTTGGRSYREVEEILRDQRDGVDFVHDEVVPCSTYEFAMPYQILKEMQEIYAEVVAAYEEVGNELVG